MCVSAQGSEAKVTGPVAGPSVLYADVTLKETAEIPLVLAVFVHDQKALWYNGQFAHLLHIRP